MKTLNIPCDKFSVIMESSEVDQRDQWIEVIALTDTQKILSQFSAKEIVEYCDIGSLLDEIGMLVALDHYAAPGYITMEDFKAILERAK